jgi:hypothetical protein
LLKKPRTNKETGWFSHPYTRIWTAVDRNRAKTIAFKIGDSDKSNFIELALHIEQICGKIKYLCTDEYKAYCSYKLAKIHIRELPSLFKPKNLDNFTKATALVVTQVEAPKDDKETLSKSLESKEVYII